MLSYNGNITMGIQNQGHAIYIMMYLKVHFDFYDLTSWQLFFGFPWSEMFKQFDDILRMVYCREEQVKFFWFVFLLIITKVLQSKLSALCLRT